MPPDRRGANYPPRFHLAASKHITLTQTLPEADRVPITPWRFHKVASNNIRKIQTLPKCCGVQIPPLPLSQGNFQQNQNDTQFQQTLPQGRRVPITPLRFHKIASNNITMMQTLLQGDFYNAHTFLLHEHMPLSTPAAVMNGTMPSCMALTVKATYNSASSDASRPGALAPTISQL